MRRIDVHSHLLPGIDDGCRTLDESVECARKLVEMGYSHSFCTPHIWINLPDNNRANLLQRTADLQAEFDRRQIPLRVLPGGEINLRPDVRTIPPQELVTFGLRGKHALIDLWAERIPPHFEPSIRWMQSLGLTVILAHPERMRAVQEDPGLADWLSDLGVLLQGNFQCFHDPPHMSTRRTAEQFLHENRYFVLGTDLHGLESLPSRLGGFQRVQSLVDPETFDRLTIHNPRSLVES
jgi:protein-tyrosine phosphatase